MLVLDASGSILQEDWPKVQTFAKTVVDQLNTGNKLGPNGSRVGIVTFGNTATLVQPLTTDAQLLYTAIANLQKTTGTTNTAAALTTATNNLVALRQPNTQCQTIKLMTDGMSNEPTMTQQAGDAAIAQNITVVAIGVGPMVNQTELELIASEPVSKNAMELTDFTGLDQLAHALFDRCAVPVPPALNVTQECECDVMIVLDGSGSVPPTEWERMRDFARVYANAFKARMDSQDVRMGLITYSTTAILNSGLTYDYKALLAAINAAVRPGGSTNTAAAITMAAQELIQNQRANLTCQTMKVVTDGYSNNPAATARAAYTAKTTYQIEILAVGIGSGVSRQELTAIASEPLADNLILLQNFSNLTVAAHKLADVCDLTLNGTTDTVAIDDLCHCDLYMLLDSSAATTTAEWQNMQQFAQGMVSNLYNYLGPQDVRVTIITFATTATVVVKQSSNYNELMGAINNMKLMGGVANTYLAIDLTRQLIETDTANVNKCKIVKLVTDGAAIPANAGKAAAASHYLKKLDLADVMVIAVGAAQQNVELSSIVSPPVSSHLINASSWAALATMPSQLVGQCNHSITASPLLPAKTPTPPPIDDCICDMMIVLDNSGSVPTSAWIQMLDFARIIVNDLKPMMGPNKARIGIVKYSSTAWLISGLTYDANALLRSISGMGSTTSGGTRTDLAISAATQELIRSPRSMPKKCKTIKLVTDGASNIPSATISAAHTAKVYGIQIFAIGVGAANKVELNAVATDPDSKNVVMLTAFSGLDQWAHAIGDKCNNAGTSTPQPLPFASDPCHCDYALILDTSSGLGTEFPLIVNFANTFINALKGDLKADGSDTRITTIAFAATAYVVTPLTGSAATLTSGLTALPRLVAGTNTAAAILAAQGQFLANSRGLWTCKRMVIVTDGQSTPLPPTNPSGTQRAVAQAHIAKAQYGINIQVVGLNLNAAALVEANNVASSPLTTNVINLQGTTNTVAAQGLARVASSIVGQCSPNSTLTSFQQDCQCDIMLVLDGSGSVPASAWTATENFCTQLVTGWMGALQTGTARIGIVTYGSSPKLVSPLTNNAQDLLGWCSNMTQNFGGTDTAAALNLAGTQLTTYGGLCRGIKLLTDGNSNNPKATDAVAERLKLASRVHIMAIGIGTGINMNELRDVASAPVATNAINIGDFSGLGTVANGIVGKCTSAVYTQVTDCQYTNMMRCTVTNSRDRCALPNAYNSCANTYKCQDVLKYLCATQFQVSTLYKTCPNVPSMCTAANQNSGCNVAQFSLCQSDANKYATLQCARLNRYVACAMATACQDMTQAYCTGSVPAGCSLTACSYLKPVNPNIVRPILQALPIIRMSAAEQEAIDSSLSMFLPNGQKWNPGAHYTEASSNGAAILGGLAVLVAVLAAALVGLIIKYRRSALAQEAEYAALDEQLVA